MRWTLTDGYDWAKRFDETFMEWMLDEPSDVVRLTDHPDYPEAVPTPEHFIPLLHLAGLASQDGDALDVLVGGCVFGSTSMTAYTLGIASLDAPSVAASSPVEIDVSPDESNI